MTNFSKMLTELRKMQLPIITVTHIPNGDYSRHYIILPNNKDKITVFVFDSTLDEDQLVKVDVIDMSFQSAIAIYSQTVLNNPGSTFKLMSI